MITFLVSILILVSGYLFYSRFLEKVFGVDPKRATPAIGYADRMDFVPLPWWKAFLIQFLNIAGLGPIFGAVAGAMWGPVAYFWIVLGAIFAGATHDFFSGMLSVRHNGLSITEIIGIYLGRGMKQFVRGFTVILMVLVGAVFITGPAKILAGLTPHSNLMTFWVAVIFIYYFLATFLPIDKIIGRIYPVFGFAMIFMAVGLIAGVVIKGHYLPELNLAHLRNFHSDPERFPIFPMLVISIACGAISGFHATQSPMMARCITSEKEGRRVFYGAMIAESIVALIWATISMSFFGSTFALNQVMAEHQGNAAFVVNMISNSLLGKFGGLLAILGVVAAPITSGDTAFRAARLMVADIFKVKQKPWKNRLLITIPLFVAGFLLTRIDFGIIWRYFAWSNQTLATLVLWTITIFLVRTGKNFRITLLPALFMTSVITTYLMLAPEGFALSKTVSYTIGGLASLFALAGFLAFKYRNS